MKRILFLTCTLLLLAIDALAQPAGMAPPPSDWKRYTVRNEEFSITLPTLPAMDTDKLPKRSPLDRDRWLRQLGVYADGVVYTISTIDDRDQNGAPTYAIKALLRKQEWDMATEQTVTVSGFTGKQYTSTNPTGGTTQVFVTKKRFYRISAFGTTASDPRVQHFFSSLVLGKSEGIEVSNGPGEPFEPLDGSVKIPADSVFTNKDVDRKIWILMRPEPSYSEQARQHAITGKVVLKTVFSANGSVVNIEVMSDLPDGLTDRAIAAAQKIKFIPAAKDGRFVSTSITLEYYFNLY